MGSHTKLLAALCLVSSLPSLGLAQDSALIVLKMPGADANPCSMTSEPKLVTLRDLKINGKADVRLAGELGNPNPSSSVSRNQFSKLKKVRLRDVGEMEIRNGLMYVGSEGQKALALPDVEPGRGQSISFGQYSGMSLEGEVREGKSKQKQVVPLQSIWRIFILGTVTQDEALFRHAQEDATVAQWTFYLSKVPSYRVKEASDGLAKSTNGCLDRAMERFRNGEFSAIEEAKELGSKVVAMSGATGPAADRLAGIKKEEEEVRGRIRVGMQQRREQKWDEALSTWEPLKKYLKDLSLKDFTDAYNDTLGKSHDFHVDAAKAAEQGDAGRGLEFVPDNETPLRKALREYEIALTRQPASTPAKQGRREMSIRLAMIEAKKLKGVNKHGEARDVLLAVAKEHGEDSRVAAELQAINCLYGSQLYDQARVLVAVAGSAPSSRPNGPPQAMPQRSGGGTRQPAPAKPSAPAVANSVVKVRVIQTPADKKPFVEAREKLSLAMGICPTEDKARLISAVNAALGDYHVGQAKKATMRKLYATALLHLNAAESYQHERPDLEALLTAAREPVQQKAQIHAGVVITSSNPACAEVAQQVGAAVESAVVEGGGTNVQMVTREQADQALRRIKTGSSPSGGGNYAIVSGQISTCTINMTNQTHSVSSNSQTHNDTYDQLENSIRAYDRQIEECKRANPTTEKTACSGLRMQRSGVQDQKGRQQSEILTPYTYLERPITTTGQVKLTLQIDDSILRGTRPVGEAVGTLNETCVERSGVRDNDQRRLAGQAIDNMTCPPPDRSAKLFEMAEQVKSQAQTQVASAFRGVSRSYLELAKRATDQEIALENYIVFSLLSAEKSSPEYQQAVAAIRARDADLKPETALR